MFSATYTTPEASAYRAGMNRHYVKCKECGNDVCGTYANHPEDEVYCLHNPIQCSYRHDDCEPGAGYDDGDGVLHPFCSNCR